MEQTASTNIVKATGHVLLWLVIVVTVMVAAAYFWVWIYATFVNDSGDHAFYEAYAQVASPVVAVLTAFPVFYAMGRFMRRFGDMALKMAGAVLILNISLDAMALITVANDVAYVAGMSAVSLIAKSAGTYFGAKT